MVTLADKETLFDLGYFDAPNRWDEVKRDELDKLTSDHQCVVEAVRAFQNFCARSMEAGVAIHHPKRTPLAANADGIYGPATIYALEQRRAGCNCRDFPDPNQATGSGSWPAGCHADRAGGRTDEHQVTFALDMRRIPDVLKPRIEGIMSRVVTAWGRMGVRMIRLPFEEVTNIDIEWEHSNSWAGLAEYNRQICGDHVFNKIAISYSRSADDDQMCYVIGHEVGHNMNCPHVRELGTSDVMEPILPPRGTNWAGFRPRDRSIPLINSFFGGEPIDDIDPVPLPDVPLTGELTGVVEEGIGVVIEGVLTAGDGQESTNHIIVPGDRPGVYVPRPQIQV